MSDPRKYAMWDESVRLVRKTLVDAGFRLQWRATDALAEEIVDEVLGYVVTQAEADVRVEPEEDRSAPAVQEETRDG